MAYLVTGGAGFIGSHLVEKLVGDNARVRVLDNFTTGKRENIAPFLDRLDGDHVLVLDCADADLGWKIAREMGRLDVGQSVAVKDKDVIAIEAIEGTDAMIARAGALCKSGGWTLVKAAKPNQDMRFDVPTIGVGTIEGVSRAGGKAIVIEAGKTLILNRDETIALADRHGISIEGRRGISESNTIAPNP